MASFATLAEFTTRTGWWWTPHVAARCWPMPRAIIRRYTGQDLEETAGRQEEHAGGMGRYQIQLTQVPVTAVSAITEDAVAFTEFQWTRWGKINRTAWTTWDDGPIVITYDSGYAAASDEIAAVKGITVEMVARALGGTQDTFGIDAPELRGAPYQLFLTQQETMQLDSLERGGRIGGDGERRLQGVRGPLDKAGKVVREITTFQRVP